MPNRCFFTREMGLRLREIRNEAGLTQDQVGDRMGLQGKHRKVIIMKLETGRVSNPHLRTIALFLRACGARWSRISDLLERVEPVVASQAQLNRSGFPEPVKRELKQMTEQQVGKYQRRMAYPAGGQALHPKRQRAMTRKFAAYRTVANTVEQEATEFLRTQPVIIQEYVKYKVLCRKVLSVMWQASIKTQAAGSRRQATSLKEQVAGRKSQGARRRGEAAGRMPGAAEWKDLGLDPGIAARVQRLVHRRCRQLLAR